MPFEIVRNDIVTMQVDAIVNAAAPELLGGGGVDGAIHKAAGPGLLAECRTLGGCATGSAKVTGAYDLPAKYVIHTVGPVWQGGGHGERELLASCYRNSLQLALELGCKAVAFPLISSGAYGYPVDQALRVAVDTIGGFLLTHEMDVSLVIFDKVAYRTGNQLFDRIAAYIDDRYTEPFEQENRTRRRYMASAPCEEILPVQFEASASVEAPCAEPEVMDALRRYIRDLDAGFSETLLQLIDRSGRKDSEVYKRANLDRKLFSKIRSNPDYKPSKPTALALAIALELDLEQTEDLIGRAGYALSPSSRFDLIIEYFISRGVYDIFQINEALFAFDQPLLGG